MIVYVLINAYPDKTKDAIEGVFYTKEEARKHLDEILGSRVASDECEFLIQDHEIHENATT